MPTARLQKLGRFAAGCSARLTAPVVRSVKAAVTTIDDQRWMCRTDGIPTSKDGFGIRSSLERRADLTGDYR
jgi:hypothetical protein